MLCWNETDYLSVSALKIALKVSGVSGALDGYLQEDEEEAVRTVMTQ